MRGARVLVLAAAIAACRGGAAPPVSGPSGPRAVAPVLRDGVYVFAWGERSFEVDPRIGGRITAFAIGGRNVLSGPDVNEQNFGSTFWTSPQSDWDWPPPAEIDRAPYAATIDGATLVVQSVISESLHVRITKTFTVAGDDAVALTYAIENTGGAPRSFAAWEVTRLPVTGVTFFPTGERAYGSGPFHPLRGVHDAGGHTWFQLEPGAARGDEQELFADGAGGFAAHADGDTMLVKTFDDLPPAARAPEEAEIEIYVHADPEPGARYLELEVQGPYVRLAPHQRTSWKTTWHLVRLPAEARAAIGDPALVAFVTRLARRDR